MNKIKPTKEQLNEEYITANADIVDWGYVSRYIHIPHFSDEFFIKFKHDIKWFIMAYHNTSMTTDLAHRHEKEIKSKNWYKNGELHRIDEPAIIHSDGKEEWFQNGKRHRDNGPAIFLPNGTEHWYQNGRRIYK